MCSMKEFDFLSAINRISSKESSKLSLCHFSKKTRGTLGLGY